MNEQIEQIRETINKTNGLKFIALLEEETKEIIKELEEERNQGVFECLKRSHTILLTHDSSFRDPVCEIVKGENENLIFPGIPFPEVNAKNVVSSSPSERVHKALIEMLHLHIHQEDATLIIGFDL